MKKVTYLVVLMFALVIVSISCKKDDTNPTPEQPTGLTVSQILGDWNFVSLEIDGNTYTACSTELKNKYNFATLNLNFTTTKMTEFDFCSSTPDLGYDDSFVLKNNQINWSDGKMVFLIDNADTFNGTVLKLKWISTNYITNAPINGILTLSYSN
jgi:hypothetical protein